MTVTTPNSLKPEQLRRACDPTALKVKTTAELEPLREAIGRARYIKEEDIEQISDLLKQIDSELEELSASDQAVPATVAQTQTES